jgi:hypothetical protein
MSAILLRWVTFGSARHRPEATVSVRSRVTT